MMWIICNVQDDVGGITSAVCIMQCAFCNIPIEMDSILVHNVHCARCNVVCVMFMCSLSFIVFSVKHFQCAVHNNTQCAFEAVHVIVLMCSMLAIQ